MPSARETRFRADRWARAGATKTQLAELEREHKRWGPERQAAEGQRIDEIADFDLTAELDVRGEKKAPEKKPGDAD